MGFEASGSSDISANRLPKDAQRKSKTSNKNHNGMVIFTGLDKNFKYRFFASRLSYSYRLLSVPHILNINAEYANGMGERILIYILY